MDGKSSDSDTKSARNYDSIRNHIAFWVLAAGTNFGFAMSLSAAHDIMGESFNVANNVDLPENRTGNLISQCNQISTGGVLLVAIIPTLLCKAICPFFINKFSYWFRFAIIFFFGLISFPIIAGSHSLWGTLFGVVCASIQSGFGELTFLSLTTFFDKSVLASYSSGSGASLLLPAFAYAALSAIGLSPRLTILLMICVPITMLIVYSVVIVMPPTINLAPRKKYIMENQSNEEKPDQSTRLLAKEMSKCERVWFEFKSRLKMIFFLRRFILPLMVVYFMEFFINQGLDELVYFEDSSVPVDQQYRWYQMLYQLGVFISRSSLPCIRIQKLWILPILQTLNMVLFLLQIFYKFLPSVWFVFGLSFYEGLLGGAIYANAFYTITEEIEEEEREYSIGATSVGDSIGIAMAAFLAIPVHNYLCTL